MVIAPDKFKGCLPAFEIAQAIAQGCLDTCPDLQIHLHPMSDGGEGFVDALVRATRGQFITAKVSGPLPEQKVDATYGILGSANSLALSPCAVIEMSSASGIALLKPDQLDPKSTTTFGTGELIAHAIKHGAKRILLGIGGSATIDAGIGAAQACGFTILMKDGQSISPTEPLCGRDVENVLMVKHGRGEVTNGIPITVACDVTNPLYGPLGAANVYGPQKGATPDDIAFFDHAFEALARRMNIENIANTPGAGAAGGLGFGMMAFFGAKLERGFDIVANSTHLQDQIKTADLVITGEGRFDASSLHGKAASGVADLCQAQDKDCLAICGDREQDLTDDRFHSIAALTDVVSKDIALKDTANQLRKRAATLFREWLKKRT